MTVSPYSFEVVIEENPLSASGLWARVQGEELPPSSITAVTEAIVNFLAGEPNFSKVAKGQYAIVLLSYSGDMSNTELSHYITSGVRRGFL